MWISNFTIIIGTELHVTELIDMYKSPIEYYFLAACRWMLEPELEVCPHTQQASLDDISLC